MADDSALSLLKQASVFIRGPDGTGSGYLVAAQRIGTAHHVVKSWQPGRRYEVLIGTGEERRRCTAWLVDADVDADAALLAFDEAVMASPLPVDKDFVPQGGAHWDSYGYPALTNRPRQEVPQGLPLAGSLADSDAEGRLLLKSPDIGAGNASPLHGFSGSPVLVDGKLVGHLIRHIGDSDDPDRPALGMVYACAARAVLALLAAEQARSAALDPGPRDALDPTSFRDPDVLYLLVVFPPVATTADGLALDDQAQLAWDLAGPDIVKSVNLYRAGLRLPPVPATAVNGGFVVVNLRVEQALASMAGLRRAAQALCRCEAALFDLTGYDPGVLFLLGIRSVARRGVTLTSIGSAYTLGNGPDLPFNLQLLNLASHATAQLERGDGMRPHELIGGKLISGFSELADLPHYLDLPVYDSVRQLGVDAAARKPILYTEKVLVLCPFGKAYTERNWRRYLGLELAVKLKEHARRAQPPEEANVRVERLLEVRTPRLVAQSLYEAIRLVDLCIIDWTECRPNVMFEAGVRLATNALGAVHIIDVDSAAPPAHIRGLMQMLNPVSYRCAPGKVPYDEMIRRFDTSLRDYGDGRRGDVFDAVGAAIDLPSQSVALPLAEELMRGANLLSSDDEESIGIPPLFSEVNKELAETVGRAAAERRLAAWLFLSHRYTHADIAGDAKLFDQFALLSAQVQRWANHAGRTDLENQVTSFEARFSAVPATVESLIRRAKVATERAKVRRDKHDYTGAIAFLTPIVDQLAAAAPATDGSAAATQAEQRLAAQLADCLGMLGGNLRRAGQLEAARMAFERGRPYEESARLQVASSYNLVNAITLPLESGTATTADLTAALRDAITALERQVGGERRRDRWAWADLAECRLLSGDLEGARSNYEQASRLGDAETVDSIVGVLRRLRSALQSRDPPAAERIDAAILQLGGAGGAA